MPLPHHFKNPFIEPIRIYRTNEIFAKITLNDLIIVPFKNIHIRKEDPNDPRTKITRSRIMEADTRYPPVIYKSSLDPLLKKPLDQEYCIFDGNHRVIKMISEGKTASACFVITPQVFEGLKSYDHVENRIWAPRVYQTRSTSCCEE